MRDLECRLLTPRVVAGLTGLSQRTLRRWEEKGLLPFARRRQTQRPPRNVLATPRLYSWREVEQLQRATHLLKRKRLRMDQVKRLLERSQAAALDRDWVIARRVTARPAPKVRRHRRAAAAGYGGGVRFSRTPTRRMR